MIDLDSLDPRRCDVAPGQGDAGRWLAAAVLAFFLALILPAPVAWSQSSPAPAFDLAIKGDRIAGGRKIVQVTQGDRVTLRWSSPQPVEVHLHGYDIEAKVAPGAPTAMTFEAHATGRFPVALHSAGHHDKTILYVEVHPR